MSEENNDAPVEQEVPKPNGEVDSPNEDETVEYWRSRARSWEKQSKENKDAALKWSEYQSSLKTIEEQRAEEMTRVQNELAQERAARLRLEIASERGITGDAVKLLDGLTREEIEEKAEALSALIQTQTKPKQPQPDSNQGRTGSATASTGDLFAQAIGDF